MHSLDIGEKLLTVHATSTNKQYARKEESSSPLNIDLLTSSGKPSVPCVKDEECLSGLCQKQQCTSGGGTVCPNSCSEKGSCVAYSLYGTLVRTPKGCLLGDEFCQPKCQCLSGQFGADCSIIQDDFKLVLSLRDTMCRTLMMTLSTADAMTPQLFSASLTSFSALFSDPLQLSKSAMLNCTESLVDMISTHSNMITNRRTAGSAVKTIGLTLDRKSILPDNLINRIEHALYLIGEAFQTSQIIGETDLSVFSKNVRVYTSKVYSGDLPALSFSAVPSAVEVALDVPVPQIRARYATASMSDPVGVSVIEFNLNLHSGSNPNTSVVQLATTLFADADSADVTIVIPNKKPMIYFVDVPYVSSHACPIKKDGLPYNTTVYCPLKRSFTYTCPGMYSGRLNYTCPTISILPMCLYWNAQKRSYQKDSSCTVLSFSDESTTCSCAGLVSELPSARRLSVDTTREILNGNKNSTDSTKQNTSGAVNPVQHVAVIVSREYTTDSEVIKTDLNLTSIFYIPPKVVRNSTVQNTVITSISLFFSAVLAIAFVQYKAMADDAKMKKDKKYSPVSLKDKSGKADGDILRPASPDQEFEDRTFEKEKKKKKKKKKGQSASDLEIERERETEQERANFLNKPPKILSTVTSDFIFKNCLNMYFAEARWTVRLEYQLRQSYCAYRLFSFGVLPYILKKLTWVWEEPYHDFFPNELKVKDKVINSSLRPTCGFSIATTHY